MGNIFEKILSTSWYKVIQNYVDSKEFLVIAKTINNERKKHIIIPKKGNDLLFKAFRTTSYEDTKVVILGQDPYYGDNQFDGICFSNSTQLHAQPSLNNILQEVETDIYNGLNLNRTSNYSLYDWANQGVLMINAAHTVIKNKPGSHMKYWKNFTNEVVKAINKKDSIVWLLWGRFAQSYSKLITNKNHLIIKTSHPSPLGCTKKAPIPFIGSKCFSKTNEYLWKVYHTQIKW